MSARSPLSAEPTEARSAQEPIIFGSGQISVEQIVAISEQRAPVALSEDGAFKQRFQAALQFLEKLLQEDGVIYGVTTGYGDSCTQAISPSLANELPLHLTRFHGCGLGDYFTPQQSLAILASRAASLAQGYSGVRLQLLQTLLTLINHGIAPRIPQEGSVGASGDLTPLSYVAAVLIGEREVYYKSQVLPAAEVLHRLDIIPLTLKPKEGLAIMNGTSVMTALACLAWSRAEYLARLSSRITSVASIALKGNSNHFDELLYAVKPHPGQNQIASWIRDDLHHTEHPRNSDRIQDRYSIRCAPHVIGVLQDALPWMRQSIEIELNSANDNPIIDGLGEHVLHGGHFYGGHIAFAMDSLKNCVANIADLLDRQMALLTDTKYNSGLPANLSGSEGERASINHGFKAVHIGVSAWTAEALKQTMPASVFSRSTECHNQDKVSMGTISARDCLRVLELTEQVAASMLLAVFQALEIRIRRSEVNFQTLSPQIQTMHKNIFSEFEFLNEDRPLDHTLRDHVKLIQQRYWRLYE